MANEFKIASPLLLGATSSQLVDSIKNSSTNIVADASMVLVTAKAIYDYFVANGTNIVNPSDNRILTSGGGKIINAETNVTYDGSTFNIDGSGGNLMNINGNAGNLLSISDYSGDSPLFQINDISGIRLFQINSNGALYLNSASIMGLTTGTTSLISFDASTGTACYYDYQLSNLGTNAFRAGTITGVWNSSIGAIAWNETSTPDLSASTAAFTFTVTISGGVISLNSVITSGTWNVKLGLRIL